MYGSVHVNSTFPCDHEQQDSCQLSIGQGGPEARHFIKILTVFEEQPVT